MAHQTGHVFSVLRIRDFRVYFMGQLISVSGTWMQRVAQGWLVYHLTGSALSLGIAAFATGVPALLLMPFAGVWADQMPRRLILLTTQIAELLIAFTLAGLTLTGAVRFEHVVVAALALGITSATGEPARQAFMKEITGPAELQKGLALSAFLQNAASIIGPTIAGILLLSIGAGWCFMLNGLSYLAVIASLLSIYPMSASLTKGARSPWNELREGLAYVRRAGVIAPLLVNATVVNVLGIGVLQTLLPAFAATSLRDSVVGYSALSSAMGVGAMSGVIALVPLQNRFERQRILAVTTVLWTGLTIVFAATTYLLIAIVLAAILGFVYTTFFVTTNTLIQTHADDVYRGRVMALWSLNRFAFAPLSGLVLGALAAGIGTPLTLALCGIVGLTAILLLRQPR